MSGDDPLLNLPEALHTRGHALGVHYMNAYRGQQLIQSTGRARVAMLFDPLNDAFGDGKSEMETRWETLDTPDEKAEFEIWTHTTMNSVAIIDRDSGFVAERVWNTQGLHGAFWHAGRLRQLAANEREEVGPTRQISGPAQPVPGMPLWLPVDPEVLAVP